MRDPAHRLTQWRSLAIVACLTTAGLGHPGALGAQDLACDPGDLEVRKVEFEGNRTFGDAELNSAIATTASSWTRRVFRMFGTRRCLDHVELKRDIARLRYFYRRRGFYETAVDTAVVPQGTSAVRVRFAVTEGAPVIVDTVVVAGLDSLRGGDRMRRDFERLRGERFDRERLDVMISAVLEELRNRGYARADVLRRRLEADTIADRAVVELDFLPGRVARIGRIDFEIFPRAEGKKVEIPAADVRDIISLREGAIYRERDLFRSQRDLYQLETYRFVEIGLAPDSVQPRGDSLLIVRATLQEAPMYTARVGLGWATLDCFRAQGRLIDRDFMGGARRLEVTARLSKIGVSSSAGEFRRLCFKDLRGDPFSQDLNYFGGATLQQPTLLGLRITPSLTFFSERRSEFKAYLRETPIGGVLSATREQRPRLPVTLAYQLELGRTDAEDAVFCAAFNVCEVEAIRQLKRTQTNAVVRAQVTRDRTDNLYDPRHGDIVRLELRHSSPTIGSDVRFNKWTVEASMYRGAGQRSVFAARLQVGGVLALGSLRAAREFVPPQERLYGGGPNSVRGFQQNQLGPIVYLVEHANQDSVPFTIDPAPGGGQMRVLKADSVLRNPRVSPTGGNSLMIMNAEWRTRGLLFPNLLQWALFMDGGQVYNRFGSEFVRLSGFRWTPGVGVRIASPVGPIRFDLAYNPYPASFGRAYYQGRDAQGNLTELVCVSPNNRVGSDVCPTTYAPRAPQSFTERLTFHFSIGQAF